MKPQGSNVPPTVDMMLAAYGLDRAKIKAQGGEIIQVNPEQTPDIMREGRADILLDTVLKGHPMITEVSLTADVSFSRFIGKSSQKAGRKWRQAGAISGMVQRPERSDLGRRLRHASDRA